MKMRRDFLLVVATAGLTWAVMAFAQEVKPREIMGSTIIDWNQMVVKKTAKGETRKVFQAPTATLDELECHITTLNPGETAHPPHQHPDEELLVIKEGSVECLVNGDLKRVGPGSVVFPASNQLHNIKNVGESPATYHVIKWNSPGMLKPKARWSY